MFCHRGFMIAILCSWMVALANANNCKQSSVAGCLQANDIQRLPSTGNLSSYCPAAVSLAYQVYVCLDDCNFTATAYIQNFLTRFQSTCSGTSGCKYIGSFYQYLQSCFNSSGGLSELIDVLIDAFNDKQQNDKLCRSLAQGKNCMRSAVSSCSYLGDVMDNTFDLFDGFEISQRICGSENVPSFSDDSTCSNSKDMITKITRDCDISCTISATSDPDTICSFLQSQVDCFLSRSIGCTTIETRFIRPRINTYAIANIILQCRNPIQLRGVVIQPAGLSPDYPENSRCKYVQQINDCLGLNLEADVRLNVIEQLLNGNFLTDHLCAVDPLSYEQLVTNCAGSFLRCRLPVGDTYDRTATYNNLYNVALGPFPLDVWGLNTVLSNLSCPNPRPPTLCQRSAKTIIASTPLSLGQTRGNTKRTTPMIKSNTPPSKKDSNGNPGANDPLKQLANPTQQQQPSSSDGPKYKATPLRTTPGSAKP